MLAEPVLSSHTFWLIFHHNFFFLFSAKFDEWFDQNSDLIRMINEPTQSEEVVKNFQVDEEVLAKWTDSKVNSPILSVFLLLLLVDYLTLFTLFFN